MDTVHNSILFHNGSEITVTYEPYPENRFLRGYRADELIVDEFCGVSYLKMTPEEIQSRFNQWWNDVGQYEFSIHKGQITLKKKEAPDLGEFPLSQELNDFVDTLALGE